MADKHHSQLIKTNAKMRKQNAKTLNGIAGFIEMLIEPFVRLVLFIPRKLLEHHEKKKAKKAAKKAAKKFEKASRKAAKKNKEE